MLNEFKSDCDPPQLVRGDSACSTNRLELSRTSASVAESNDMHEVDYSESRKSWRERLKTLQTVYDKDEQEKISNKKTPSMSLQHVLSDHSESITILPESYSASSDNSSEYNQQGSVRLKSGTHSHLESLVSKPDVLSSSWDTNENSASSIGQDTFMTQWENSTALLASVDSSIDPLDQLNSNYGHHIATGINFAKVLSSTEHELSKPNEICVVTDQFLKVHACSLEICSSAVNRWDSDCIKELTSSLNISSMLENASDLDDSFWDPGSDSIDSEVDEAATDFEIHQAIVTETVHLEPCDLSEPQQYSAVQCAEHHNNLSTGCVSLEIAAQQDSANLIHYPILIPTVECAEQQPYIPIDSVKRNLHYFESFVDKPLYQSVLTSFRLSLVEAESDVEKPPESSSSTIVEVVAKNDAPKDAEDLEPTEDMSSSSPRPGKSRSHRVRKHASKSTEYSLSQYELQSTVVSSESTTANTNIFTSDSARLSDLSSYDMPHSTKITQSTSELASEDAQRHLQAAQPEFDQVNKDTKHSIQAAPPESELCGENPQHATQVNRSSSYSRAVDFAESNEVPTDALQPAVVPRHSSYLRAIDTVASSSTRCSSESSVKAQPKKDFDENVTVRNKGMKKVDEKSEKKRKADADKLEIKKANDENNTPDVKLREGKKLNRRKSYRIATVFKAALMPISAQSAQSEQQTDGIPAQPPPAVLPSAEAQPNARESTESETARNGSVAESPVFTQPTTSSGSVFTAYANVPTMKGNLDLKISHLDGKRLSNRSWKAVYAVVQSDKLHLYNDVSMSALVCNPPLNVQSCQLDIVLNVRNRKVFRLLTQTRSSYMFGAENDDMMNQWIAALSKSCQVVPSNAVTTSKSRTKVVDMTTDSKVAVDSKKPPLPVQMSFDSVVKVIQSNNVNKPPDAVSAKSVEKSQQKDSKNWKARFADKFRSAASTEAASAVRSTFGLPLDKCVSSPTNGLLPLIVDVCIRKIEENGLSHKGIYRVPGNTASIASLQADIDKDPVGLNLESDKWQDVNVVVSILKLFFRKLPESLATDALYPQFIAANADAELKLAKIRSLLFQLPKRNIVTFHVMARHLSVVASMESVNMMSTRNLAVVFGPTLIQPRDTSMLNMVKDMSAQCQVVEAIILNYEWLFSAPDEPDCQLPAPVHMKSASSDVPVSSIDHILQEKAESLAISTKEDNLKRIMRRVSRAKSNRKNRSKSAHGDLRMVYAERNIDEEVAKQSVEQSKSGVKTVIGDESSDLTTAAKTTLSRKHSGSLSRLPVEQSLVVAVDKEIERPPSPGGKPIAQQLPPTIDSKRYQKAFEKKSKRSTARSPPAAEAAFLQLQPAVLRPSSTSNASMPSVKDDSHTSKHTEEPVANRPPIVHSGMSYLGSSSGVGGLTASRVVARSKQSPSGNRHRNSRHHQSAVIPIPLKKWLQPAEVRPVFSELDISPTSGVEQRYATVSLSNAPSECEASKTELQRSSSIASGRRHESLPNLSPSHENVEKLTAVDDEVPFLEMPIVPRFRVTEKRTWNLDTCNWENAYLPPYTPPAIHVHINSDWNSDGSSDSLADVVVASSNAPGGQGKLRFESFSKSDVTVGVWRPLVATEVSNSSAELSAVRPPVQLRKMKRALRALENIAATSSFYRVAEDEVAVAVTAPTRHSVNEDDRCANHRTEEQLKRSTWPLYRQSSCPILLSVNLAQLSGPSSGPSYDNARSTGRQTNGKSKRSGRSRRPVTVVEPQPLPPSVTNHMSWIGHGDLIGSLLTYESSV